MSKQEFANIINQQWANKIKSISKKDSASMSHRGIKFLHQKNQTLPHLSNCLQTRMIPLCAVWTLAEISDLFAFNVQKKNIWKNVCKNECYIWY